MPVFQNQAAVPVRRKPSFPGPDGKFVFGSSALAVNAPKFYSTAGAESGGWHSVWENEWPAEWKDYEIIGAVHYPASTTDTLVRIRTTEWAAALITGQAGFLAIHERAGKELSEGGYDMDVIEEWVGVHGQDPVSKFPVWLLVVDGQRFKAVELSLKEDADWPAMDVFGNMDTPFFVKDGATEIHLEAGCAGPGRGLEWSEYSVPSEQLFCLRAVIQAHKVL